MLTRPGILPGIGLLLLLLISPVQAKLEVAPNEVIFFDLPEFQGPSLAVRLEPGMRQALKPALGALDNKISSILMGEKVKALVFTDPDFRGAVRLYDYTIAASMPDHDDISSFLVCLKEEPPQGVLLIQKRVEETKTSAARPWHYITGRGIFFPLPESKSELEARFPTVAGDWRQARYVSLAPAVETDLFSGQNFQGRLLSLPGPSRSRQGVFDLSSFGFYDPKPSADGGVSSLVVRTKKDK